MQKYCGLVRLPCVLVVAVVWAACSTGPAERSPEETGSESTLEIPWDDRIEWEEVERVELGSEGGLLQTADGRIRFYIPPDALSEPVSVRLLVPSALSQVKWSASFGDPILPGTRVRIEPVELELAELATLTIRVEPGVIPVALTSEDVGFQRREVSPGDGWGTESVSFNTGRYPGFFGGDEPNPGDVGFTAFTRMLGTYRVAIHDPYRDPPQIVRIREGSSRVLTDGGGIRDEVTNRLGGTGLALDGQGFGWDTGPVRVTVDGEEVETSTQYNRMIRFALESSGTLSEPLTRNVQVHVGERSSNVMPVRIAASRSCVADVERIDPPLGQPGTEVRVLGNFCGTEDTRRVYFGDVAVRPERRPDMSALVVQVPRGIASGWTDLRVSDGVGGAPGGGQPFYVVPTVPVELRPGPQHAGLFVPRPQPHLPVEEQSLSMILEIEGLEAWFRHTDWDDHRTEVRFQTRLESTDWGPLTAMDAEPLRCGSDEGPGYCFIEVPYALLVDLEEGDALEVTIRRAYRPGWTAGIDRGERVTRTSNPVSIPVRPESFVGMSRSLSIADTSSVPFCNNFLGGEDRVIVAQGDMVCLRESTLRCPDCEPEEVLLSAPGVFSGTLPLHEVGNAPIGLRSPRVWCFLASELGEYEIHNHTLGRTCTVEARRFAPGTAGAEVLPGQGIVLGAGGVRFEIPPGALPMPSNGAESVAVRLDVRDDWYGEEPVVPLLEIDRHVSISFEPQVHGFHLSPVLTIPDAAPPGAQGAPELGLADPASGGIHFLDQVRQLVDGALQWELPAGLWGSWPEGVGSDMQKVMPARVNAALGHVGVVHRRVQPGQITDAWGRVLVDYVTDPTDQSFVDDATAQTVLAAAIEAYEMLEELGWRLPSEMIRVYIRRSVSWFDVQGRADGATGAGWLGQPTVAIRSTIETPEIFRYVTMHEIGHVFQREYTTEAVLTWLDEGAAEWVAWRLLGDRYPMGALQDENCAVELATRQFPTSWTMILGPKCHYASVAWLIWLDENHGPESIRRIYEILADTPRRDAPPRTVIVDAAQGLESMTEMQTLFAEDFWMLRMPAVDRLAVYGQQIGLGMNVFREITQPSTLTISMRPRPNLSSNRYRIHVTDNAVGDPLYKGDLVLRATELGTLQDLIVLHEPDRVLEISEDTEHVVTLTAAAPSFILPGIRAGTWWVVDNNASWAENLSDHTFSMELPRITGISPSAVTEGTRVTISADSIGGATGHVTVGGRTVTPHSWTPSQVRFDMPYFSNTTSVGVVVHTEEGARTNQVFFTYQESN